jgi:Trp operon repressor
MDKKASLIQSLLAERAGYVSRGLHARVAAVDEVLASLGQRELASVEPEVEVATVTKGKRRKKTESR